jgi:hypothetical protein
MSSIADLEEMKALEAVRNEQDPEQSGRLDVYPDVSRVDIPGWPKPLAEPAFHGLAGDVVRMIDPHTEADPASILLQLLVAVGNVVGRNPHFVVEATQHYPNLFVALVGDTAKARKGTSWGHINRLFGLVEGRRGVAAGTPWCERTLSGLSSGEGLIWAVRDPMELGDSYDQGVEDKRRIVIDSEFAQTLKVMSRQGNTLSPVIRQAWDGGVLQIVNKNSPAKATGAHISIVGHITRDELKRELTSTEIGNGFANRFLWACVTRSKMLPDGGNLHERHLKALVERVHDVIGSAANIKEIKRDEDARAIWHKVYADLSSSKSGMLGAVTARAEAQVMRLGLLYALLDGSSLVEPEHLNAALAVWDYCEASAGFLFGNATGDHVADQILDALRRSGSQGMSRTQIRDLFNRNESKDRIESALRVLEDRKLAERKIWGADQRTEMWFAR